MNCNYCNGDAAIFWKDENNHAFVDSKGEMMVVANSQEVRFQVDRCPKCGRLFNGINYLNLRHGDDIWYADEDEGVVEHGTIYSIHIKDDKVDSFSVNFDNGDFDEFCGSGLGVHYFMHKIDAEESLVRHVNNSASDNSDTLEIGDNLWYIDKDADEMHAEHCVVHHVFLSDGHVDLFAAKFDNGDIDEFEKFELGIHYFKSKKAAELAWNLEHSFF